MAKKQVIRLTESDLRRIIKESVNNVLKESWAYKDEQKIVSQIPYLDDNELEDIINGKTYGLEDFETDYRSGDVAYKTVLKAAENEYAKRHKDYAMKLIDKDKDKMSKNRKLFDTEIAWHKHNSKEHEHKLTPSDKRLSRWVQREIPRDTADFETIKRGANDFEIKHKFDGRNPDTQKLHTKGSLNRELRAMDKAKK
ncbi:MAG: hypothetical protein IKT53_03270 [Bacteroidaceae bacterium]|nr:hypothetical protein [Bacteroidaceae bacterium]